MDNNFQKYRENEVMKKVFQLILVFIFEIVLFGLELTVVGKYQNSTKTANQMSITYISNTLYIISALILRRSLQFRLYPVIFSFTITMAFLHPFPKSAFFVFIKLLQIAVTIFRAIWVFFFYESFKNIFDWQNFLKYKSNQRLIGKCNIIFYLNAKIV
ncbi:putative transporter [Pseudoloma neurophilia]|uniref:Putative transporter n=1 Tax=Pseudoloma neurophilia TaxID=146866 RepID=A0A0R0LV27_9MICR|nr:putative transporter [Pseudoloma neurophilia]